MRILTILIGAALVVGMSARRAEACGDGGGSVAAGVAAIVVGGAYVSSTIVFGVSDIATDDHSIAYGVLETTVNTGFAAATSAIAVDQANHDGNWGVPAALTALNLGLAAHGIYSIVKRARKHDPQPVPAQPHYDGPPGAWKVSAAITPAAIRDGAGIGLVGTF